MRTRTLGVATFAVLLLAFALTWTDGDATPARASTAWTPSTPRSIESYNLPNSDSSTVTVAATSFSITGASSTFVLPLTLPERTFHTMVEVTFHSGAGYKFALSGPSSCARTLDGPIVGDGTRLGFDCAGAPPGAQELHLTLSAGTISGYVEVISQVCGTYSLCPDIPPP